MDNRLICPFHHHHFNLLLFREKLRTISQCRNVSAQNRLNMILIYGFEDRVY